MTIYAALLRGINVGGKNLIKMADLADWFGSAGYRDVRTYIQSGNVIFSANEPDPDRLAREIETGLSSRFGYEASLVLRSNAEMRAIVEGAPEGFGSQAELYRYNVLFLKEPLTAAEAIRQVTTREGVDQAAGGEGVLYFSNLIARATQSHLSKIIGLPMYQNMTIRNWNTTTKLLGMMEAARKDGG